MVQLSSGAVGTAIVWYRSLKPAVKSLIWAALFVLPVLGSALVSYYLKLTLETTFRRELLEVAVLFVVFAFVRRYIELRCEILDQADDRQRNAHAQTFVALDSIIATCMEQLHAAMDAYQRHGPENGGELVKLLLGSLEHIQALVNALYEVVQGQFSQAGSLRGEINFEVTFMTRSYQDNEITIYASQNRDHRAPSSLLLRPQNKLLYDGTVTADIYRQPRPALRVVEDTATADYQAVYPGQLDRIKSSIVYPVLSDKSELLGTLVVHCDRTGFFKAADAPFWTRLIEPFAKRVAFEKMKFDYLLTVDLAPLANAISPSTLRPTR
jgi:GAF domain-containing protein